MYHTYSPANREHGYGNLAIIPSRDTIIDSLSHILKKITDVILESDKKRARESTYNPQYKLITDLNSGECQKYLLENQPLVYSRAVSFSRQKGESEMLQHIIRNCPIYAPLRKQLLNSPIFPDVLKVQNAKNARNVFLFIQGFSKQRAFGLGEWKKKNMYFI